MRKRYKSGYPNYTEIHSLEITRRVRNAIIRGGILTIQELIIHCDSGDIEILKGIGPKALDEIKVALIPYRSRPDFISPKDLDRIEAHEIQKLVAEKKTDEKQIRLEEYKQYVKKIEEEIKSKRLSREVLCNDIPIKLCLTVPKKTAATNAINKLLNVLKCSIKHEDINLELTELLNDLNQREQRILFARYGKKRDTLQAISENEGVTRERIRQIERQILKKIYLTYKQISFPRLQTAIHLINSETGRNSYSGWKAQLKKIGLVNTRENPDIFQHIIAVGFALSEKHSEEIFVLPTDFREYIKHSNISTDVIALQRQLSSSAKRKVRREVRNSGAVHINSINFEINLTKRQKQELLSLLGYNEIDSGWYTYKAKKDKTKIFNKNEGAMNNTLKILSVVEEIKITDLVEGINNVAGRLGFTCAPKDILLKFLY